MTSAEPRRAWGLGLATHQVTGLAPGERARVLEAWFPEPHLGDDYDDQQPMPADLRALESRDADRGIQQWCIGISIDLSRASRRLGCGCAVVEPSRCGRWTSSRG